MITAVISSLNRLCNTIDCPGWTGTVGNRVLTILGRLTTTGALTTAGALAPVVGRDLDALRVAVEQHGRNSPEAKLAAQQLCRSTTALHQALVSTVPGLSLVFPVPRCASS